jgi:hypothetical protein
MGQSSTWYPETREKVIQAKRTLANGKLVENDEIVVGDRPSFPLMCVPESRNRNDKEYA